jgi:hypothetical protein
MSKETIATITIICGFFTILYGFIQLIMGWIQISDIVGLTIEIQYWISIVLGFLELIKVEKVPEMYFFPGFVFIVIGLILVLITVIITSFSNEL